MIRNLKEFRADVEVAGQTREVSWHDGVLKIHGIQSFIEVAEVLHMLQTGQVTGWSAKDFMGGYPPSWDKVPPGTPEQEAEVTAQAAKEVTPAAPAAKPAPKLSKGDNASVLPSPPVETAPAEEAAEAPKTNGKALGLAAFGRVSRLGEVVTLAVEMGKAESFEALKAFVQELMDSEMCPILEQKVQEHGGEEGFWDRMRVLAQSKKIPGALGTA